LTPPERARKHAGVPEQVEDTRHFREEGPTFMNSTVIMPMPKRLMDAVAPAAGVRVPWQGSYAPASVGFGVELGSFVCVTSGTDLQNTTSGIDTKAHRARRPQETST
jgi:hypothetical protein